MKFTFHPDAAGDIQDGCHFYHQQGGPPLARSFLEDLDHCLQLLVKFPALGPNYRKGCRRHSLRHFPFWVVYRETDAGIIVFAVAHYKRKPGFWSRRG